MTQNYKLSPEEYKTMSGSSWPPYSDYLQGNLPKKLALEINKYEQQFN
jgi:hypothetical protein